jgi:2'-5' RNA ligase
MVGIVSLLDDLHYHLVEDLWAELQREFGVKGVYITPFPHFSYHVASDYNVEMLPPILHKIAATQASFQVRTSGLGIFTGEAPVLYIPIARNPILAQFHATLWQELSNTGNGALEYYHPEHWMPHITISFGDVNSNNLAHIVRYISGHDFSWQITVDNLALIYDSGNGQEVKYRYKLTNEGQNIS